MTSATTRNESGAIREPTSMDAESDFAYIDHGFDGGLAEAEAVNRRRVRTPIGVRFGGRIRICTHRTKRSWTERTIAPNWY